MYPNAKIPVVDLSLPDTETAKTIHDACRTYGVFYVTHHGIPNTLVQKTMSESRRFFALPNNEKMKIQQNIHDRGFIPPKAEKINATSKFPDTRERIHFGLEDLEGVLPLRGPNLWPNEKLLPEFKSTIQSYFDHIYPLTQQCLLRLIALSLNQEMTAFDACVRNPTAVLRLQHYLEDVSSPKDGLFACGEHFDWGLVAVLVTDEVDGLQIRVDGEWIGVPYMEDAFIVITGNMMEHLTNGIYMSTFHRVVNSSGRERYSIPFFLDPNPLTEIAPLPGLCSQGQKYPTMTFGDYLLYKYTKTGDSYRRSQKTDAAVASPVVAII